MAYLTTFSRRSVPNATREIRALMKAPRALYLRQRGEFPLGDEALVLRGLLGADVDDDDVQLAHDSTSLIVLISILLGAPVGLGVRVIVGGGW
jgi:hypothetical protein